MINYTIKVTAILSGKTKTFDTLEDAVNSTGVSKYFIKSIRAGKNPNMVRGKKDILFKFEFFDKEAVVLLTPAWDTSYDEVPIMPKKFHTHEQAINFLSEGGSYQCKKTTYIRRRNLQPLGEPCSVPIFDCWNRPWIVTYYTKGKFVPNK